MNAIAEVPVEIHRDRSVDVRDFIWLAALGRAARGPAPLGEVRAYLADLASGFGASAVDMVGGCIDAMRQGRHLEAAEDRTDGGHRLALTPTGHQTFLFLLGRPIPRPATAIGRIGLKLKLDYIDLIGRADRRRLLEGLVAACMSELASRDGEADGVGRFGKLWFEHDVERVRRDIALLNTLIDLNDR
ncbi:MAG: hypothetical protein H7841_09185 [Magnetospirillum sp. WYHS-4]